MRRPVLCILLAFVLTFMTAQPFVGLNAAELWNSQKRNSTGKKTYYYNKPKRTYYYNKSKKTDKKGVKLYNSKSPSYSTSNSGGLKATMLGYQKVEFSKQKTSKLWKFMSASALANRQADTDNALQIEYETRKATAKNMISLFKEVRIAQMKAEKAYQQELADYSAQKQEEALEKQYKKEFALNGGKGYTSKRSGKKKVYRVSTSKSTGSNIRLKKPKPLFNSPNR